MPNDPDARRRQVNEALAAIAEAEGMASRGDFGGVGVFVRSLGSKYWEVEEAAVYALTDIPSKSRQATEELVKVAPFRVEAIGALAAIGTPAVVPQLIALLENEDFQVRENARRALFRVLGDKVANLVDFDEMRGDPGAELAAMRDWWRAHESEFEPDIVYESGEPADLGRLVSVMEQFTQRQALAAAEALASRLAISVGHRFDGAAREELAALWRDWWQRNAFRFEAGKRYYHGHPVE